MQEVELHAFGPFALDVGQRVLRRGDEILRLTPREVDVLVVLVERHGEIVDKRRLMELVWRGVRVEECNLAQHVATLRRVLGDDAREPTYIETVPRRGYRFVAPVARSLRSRPEGPPVPIAPAPVGGDADPPEPLRAPSAPSARPRSRSVAAAALALVLGLGLGWAQLRAGTDQVRPLPTIAVLPVANLTGDARQDPLAETLTGALLRDLSAAGQRVVPASGAGEGVHRLDGVDAIVETAVLSGEGLVRLAAELIDARTGRLLWAEVVESDAVSFLDAEARVARAIASRMEAARDGTPPAEAGGAAQREYALARQYLGRRSPQVVVEALEHFTQAAGLDPGFALAWVGLADAYVLGAEQRVLPAAEALSGAEAAARKALEIDPELAEGHAALADVVAARWDFAAAEALLRRALDLDPSVGALHRRYAALLTVQDRHEQAIREARVARDLDPACPGAATALAAAYFHAGQTDAAIEQALAALRITPRFAAAYDVLGWAHLTKGRDTEAIVAFGEAVRLSSRSPVYVAALARTHAHAGHRDEARALLAELEGAEREDPASPLDVAEVLAALGESDRALKEFERAVAEGTPWLQRVDAGLSLAALHDHARFRALASRMASRSAR